MLTERIDGFTFHSVFYLCDGSMSKNWGTQNETNIDEARKPLISNDTHKLLISMVRCYGILLFRFQLYWLFNRKWNTIGVRMANRNRITMPNDQNTQKTHTHTFHPSVFMWKKNCSFFFLNIINRLQMNAFVKTMAEKGKTKTIIL